LPPVLLCAQGSAVCSGLLTSANKSTASSTLACGQCAMVSNL